MGIGDWWRGLWAKKLVEAPRRAEPSDDRGGDPAAGAVRVDTVALSPRLKVHEFRHAIETPGGVVRLRTFLSEGLAEHGAEVTVTLRVDEDESAVTCMQSLLLSVARFAAEGEPATLGGHTGFSATYGGGRPLGVTYARGTEITGLPGGTANLAAVLLHAEELELVQLGHATRVLGRLAHRARYFPYPAFWELRDEPVLPLAESQKSLVHQARPWLFADDARVTLVDDRELVVSLPRSATEEFEQLWEELPDQTGFVLSAVLAPDADGQLVWFADSEDRHATTRSTQSPGRMGHAFLMVTGGAKEERCGFIEDGALVMLDGPHFAELRAALTAGRGVAFPLDEGRTVRVVFRSDEAAPPGWVRYEPSGGRRVDVGRVAMSGITLLVTNEQLAERVETRALTDFIERATQAMERVAGEHPVAAKVPVAVTFTLRPDAPPEAEIAWRGGDAPALLGPLHEALVALAPVAVRGELAFRLETEVHPHPLGN